MGLALNGDSVTVREDVNVLERNAGDGCTAVRTCLMPRNCTLKND